MTMSSRQSQSQRISQSIYCDMHLGGKATSTTPQGLGCLTATFFVHQRHKGVHVQWCYRSCRSPYPGHRQNVGAFVPTPLSHTSERSVYIWCSTGHIRLVTTAIVHRCGLSIELLPQNADIRLRPYRYKHAVPFSENPEFLSNTGPEGSLLT